MGHAAHALLFLSLTEVILCVFMGVCFLSCSLPHHSFHKFYCLSLRSYIPSSSRHQLVCISWEYFLYVSSCSSLRPLFIITLRSLASRLSPRVLPNRDSLMVFVNNDTPVPQVAGLSLRWACGSNYPDGLPHCGRPDRVSLSFVQDKHSMAVLMTQLFWLKRSTHRDSRWKQPLG